MRLKKKKHGSQLTQLKIYFTESENGKAEVEAMDTAFIRLAPRQV